MFGGEVDDPCAVGVDEWIGRRHERIGPLPGDRAEDGLEIVGTPEPVRLERDAQGACPPLRLFEGQDAPAVFGVVDQRDARELRKGQLEQLQPLPVFRANERDPRDVAPGARVARDEARLIGEGDVRKHDRDRGRRLLGRAGGLRARRAEDIHGETQPAPRRAGGGARCAHWPSGARWRCSGLRRNRARESSPKGLQVREASAAEAGDSHPIRYLPLAFCASTERAAMRAPTAKLAMNTRRSIIPISSLSRPVPANTASPSRDTSSQRSRGAPAPPAAARCAGTDVRGRDGNGRRAGAHRASYRRDSRGWHRGTLHAAGTFQMGVPGPLPFAFSPSTLTLRAVAGSLILAERAGPRLRISARGAGIERRMTAGPLRRG